MARARAPRLIAAAAAALLVAACGKGGGTSPAPPPPDASPPPPSLGSVGVSVRGWPAIAGTAPTPEALTARLEAALAASGVYQPGGKKVRVRAEVLVALDGPPEPLTAATIVRAELEDDLPLDDRVLVEEPRPAPEDAPAKAAAAVERAIDLAAAGVIAKERLRQGDPRALDAAFAAGDREHQLYALAVVAERRARGFRDRAALLLASTDEELRDAAIGAIARVGDASSLPALTRLAKFSDADVLRRVLPAIAAIGGDEARDYLEFVRSGHAEPAIRELAAEALAKMPPKPTE